MYNKIFKQVEIQLKEDLKHRRVKVKLSKEDKVIIEIKRKGNNLKELYLDDNLIIKLIGLDSIDELFIEEFFNYHLERNQRLKYILRMKDANNL